MIFVRGNARPRFGLSAARLKPNTCAPKGQARE